MALDSPPAGEQTPYARWARHGGVVLALAAVAAVIGALAAGAQAAFGAACGGVVAYGYSWSFQRDHLAKSARGPGLDAALAGGAMGRLVLAGAVALTMWMIGRRAVVAYLLSFGVALALLLARDFARIVRQVRGT